MSDLLLKQERTPPTTRAATVNPTNRISAANGEIPTLSEDAIKDSVKIFKLLSDETRLRILSYLTRDEERHVRALCNLLGQSQPAVSHHLALLRVAGLIESRRDGKHNYYRIVPGRIGQMLDKVFENVPEAGRQIRFEDYVLGFSPPTER